MHERILVALDGSKEGESALPYVHDLLSKFSPEVEREVILLRVVPLEKVYVRSENTSIVDEVATERQTARVKKEALDYLEKTRHAITVEGVPVRCEVVAGDAPEGIVKTSETMNADLIAISTHGRSGLSRWAFGSVTDKVLRLKGKTPVVVVKASGEHPV